MICLQNEHDAYLWHLSTPKNSQKLVKNPKNKTSLMDTYAGCMDGGLGSGGSSGAKLLGFLVSKSFVQPAW